jgi:hypothetical protein
MEYSEKANNERTKTIINHQMSGNTNTNNTNNNVKVFPTEEEISRLIVDGNKCNEYGLSVFTNPRTQAYFERAQEEYKKKYKLKEAYDKQEFLCKMRADIKREYLTRKKQIKRLQTEAAVDFREAETRLQEHYSNEFAISQGRRAIDIQAPLVSCVQFREGETIDMKQFSVTEAFQDLRKLHNDIYEDEREFIFQQFMHENEREEELRAQQQQPCEVSSSEWDEVSWSEWVDGNDNVRKIREAEEAEEAERKSRWQELSHEEEQRLWFENTRDVNDPWSEDDDNDNDTHFIEEEEQLCDEVIAPAAASASASAQRIRSRNINIDNNHSHNHNAIAIANKKAAKARIAKQQKKQATKQAQQAIKFVPVQIMINDNRSRHQQEQQSQQTSSTLLYVSKTEFNLPKKNLQGASREAMKRHNQRWKQVNALAKQSNATHAWN